jgi:hypothetical protein
MEFTPINPNTWKPTMAGDAVEGVLLSIQPNNKFKEGGKIYHLETKEGAQIIIFGSAVLDDRMSYIKIGEYVKIAYKGTNKNQKGQPVKMFDVFKAKI